MFRSLRTIYRKVRYGRPIVVVSGLPRSGTSMAMKMLEAGGLEVVVDGIRTADVDNPKGYYEDERVKALGETEDKSWLLRTRGKAIKIISFLLKDLPDWNNYQVIFMRRDLEEVLASQNKMLDRRDEANETEDEKMFELWENHLWRAAYLLKHGAQFECLEVAYRRALDDPRATAESMNRFLGGHLDVDRMVAVVDKNLYRNRRAS